ncbi:hypothetical protein RF11_09202 [Thelohanellus kitauei]|uniref:FLYWCH-type domain-containing protein n=1 Tax=Thelohanellus kitauei TaxID=669202 RepID=A0A0C2MV25_THEKT|nr:hypothetical protein RF11_09202 [Thelohanellus kitauei]
MSLCIVYNSISYGKIGQHKNATYHRCSKYVSGCQARLTIQENTITEKGSYRCESQVASHSSTHPEISVDDYINTFLANKSSPPNLGSSDIYRELLISLREKYIEAVMSDTLSLQVKAQPFFRRYWLGDIDCLTHQIIILVINETLVLMLQHTFIDGTFKVTPHTFYQCVIVMIYDYRTELYVPCAFALVTGKSE